MPASTIGSSILGGLAFADKRKAQQQQFAQREREGFNALAKDRQTALFQDTQAVNTYLKNGQIDNARGVLQNRLSDLQRLGGDPTDTNEIITLLNLDKVDEAMALLDSVEQVGVQQGYLSDPRDSLIKDAKLANLQGKGVGGNSKQFEKQAQYEQLQIIKEKGTPEQLAEFRSLIGLNKEAKLSGASETALNKAQENSFLSGTAVRKMDLLAKDIAKVDIGGGAFAGWSETFKNLLGGQDEVSSLRREFRSIRSSQAVRNLPPGPASDKDIALALSGFPREDAPASEIISFLKGQAKLAKFEVAFNDFKADYISDTKGITGFGKAWRKKVKDEDFLNGIFSVNKDNNTNKEVSWSDL